MRVYLGIFYIILALFSYAIFHLAFFRYLSLSLKKPMLTKNQYTITYIINFIMFIVVSRLQFHLTFNWTLTFIFILCEVLIIYNENIWISFVAALEVATNGLAMNIMMRCIFSIVLMRPLNHFDNNIQVTENIKIYPVSLAFIIAGIIFLYLSKKDIVKARNKIYQDLVSVKFLFFLRTLLYGFLLLNLLAYYTNDNSLSTKLWGIESALFTLIGSQMSYYYVQRLSQIHSFQNQIEEDRIAIMNHKQKSEQLRYLAFNDDLTQCYNRQFSEEVFVQLEERDYDITCAFIDLDNLKEVNDEYGHNYGDRYLRLVGKMLREGIIENKEFVFRYGGDEFVVLYHQRQQEFINQHIQKINDVLKGYSKEVPIHISYGIANRDEAKNMKEVIKLADERMYQYKKEYKREIKMK